MTTTSKPGRRAQMRALMARMIRRQRRGVPSLDNYDENSRIECIHAGMPAHFNKNQMANWLSGEKLRGPGITR